MPPAAWLASVLDAVPDYREFLTPAELHRGSVRLVEEFPDLADLRTVGRSTDGRPIELLTVGQGRRTALWLGVPHPNEPVGSLSVEFLSRALCERAALRERLDTRFLFVKAIDADGLALNQGWLKGMFSPLRYALDYYRCSAAEQVEWGFPITYKTLRFSEPPAETRVVMQLVRDYRPDFYYSLHNASFCGVYYYLSQRRSGLFAELHDLVGAYDLPLHRGEPEVPFIDAWAPAVFPFFGIRPAYDYMARHLDDDPGRVITTGTCSADYVRAHVPDALSMVCELPYFTDAAITDQRPADTSRGEALAEGLTRTEATLRVIDAHFSALQSRRPELQESSARLYRSVADYLHRTPARLAAQRRQLEADTAFREAATRAQAFDALVCKPFQAVLQLGEVYRLAQAGDEAGQAGEIRGEVLRRIERLEADSNIEVLPLKKLIAVQVGSGLLAMLHAQGGGRN